MGDLLLMVYVTSVSLFGSVHNVMWYDYYNQDTNNIQWLQMSHTVKVYLSGYIKC